MRIAFFLMTAAFLQVSAAGISQNVSFKYRNAPLKEVFREIEKQTGYVFFYDMELLSRAKPVTLHLRNVPVGEALTACLKDQPFSFSIEKRTVVISPSRSVTAPPAEQQQTVIDLQITGMVLSGGDGQPLAGASVKLKGSEIGTSTGADGSFRLQVPGQSAVLVISYIGHTDREIAVSASGFHRVVLEVAASLGDEVVVVGYGSVKKESLTGAVAQIGSEGMESRPVANVARALQGLIPNLVVTNNGGSPNENPNLNVRGNTSLSGGGPLVLVDGIQMDLNLLNPLDIESVSVLKDAASAAIYGARGAFGVILVTLKSGAKRRSKAVITYNGAMEFSKPTSIPDMLSSLDYMESINLATKRNNGTTPYSEQQIQWLKDYIADPVNNPVYHTQPNGAVFWHANVDNFGEMLQPVAPAQNHSLSLQGQSDKLTYYTSLAYRRQEGMFRDATDVMDRYNYLLKLSSQLSDRINIGFSANYTNKTFDAPHQHTGKGSWWEQMTRGVPQILFPIKTPADAPVPNAPTEHFYNFLTSGARTVTNTSVGVFSINTTIDLFEGLQFKGDFSYRNYSSKFKNTRLEFGYIRDRWEYQYGHTTPSFVQRSLASENYFAGNAYLTYNKTIHKDHTISALLGYNQEWSKQDGFDVTGNALVSNDIPVLQLSTGEIQVDDREQEWAIRGVFSRLKYDFRNKYLVEMNARYDGTSRFPAASRFGFFPSVAAAWRISEENFMEGTRGVLNDLKLRASYGSLGNQLIADPYPFVNRFGIVQFNGNNMINYLIGGVLPIGLTPPGLVSADLTWESASTIDFGVDLTVFNRLDLSFDWYKRETRDMLVSGRALPAVLGTGVPSENSAKLKTVGGELSLTWRDQLPSGVRYSVGIGVSDYQATILAYDNPTLLYIQSGADRMYPGRKLGEIWGYQTVGIFQSDEDVAKAADHTPLNGRARTAGDIQYADLNGDGKIDFGNNTVTNPGDKRIIGNSTPRYQFNINGNLSWRGIDLRLFFQGIGKRDMYPTGNYYWGQINSGGAVGTYGLYNNTWSEENPNGFYPIYKANSSYNILEQTRYLENAAYIRLKNLTVGYSLPVSVARKIGSQKIRVYFSGENVLEFSGLRGEFDPEIVNSDQGHLGRFGQTYPLQRTYSFGIQASF